MSWRSDDEGRWNPCQTLRILRTTSLPRIIRPYHRRLLFSLVTIGLTGVPTIHVAIVESDGTGGNLAFILDIAQSIISAVAALLFAVVPPGRIFGGRVAGPFTASYLPCRIPVYPVLLIPHLVVLDPIRVMISMKIQGCQGKHFGSALCTSTRRSPDRHVHHGSHLLPSWVPSFGILSGTPSPVSIAYSSTSGSLLWASHLYPHTELHQFQAPCYWRQSGTLSWFLCIVEKTLPPFCGKPGRQAWNRCLIYLDCPPTPII